MTWQDRPPDAEVDDEIRFYLERKVEALIAKGMEPEDARREAERRFGNVEKVWMRMERRPGGDARSRA